jgi:hypothetical protein
MPCNHAVNLKVLEIKRFRTEALEIFDYRFVERRQSEVHGFGLFTRYK